MVQRKIKNKIIEVFFAFLVLLLFFVLLERYIISGIEKSIFFQNLKNTFIVFFEERELYKKSEENKRVDLKRNIYNKKGEEVILFKKNNKWNLKGTNKYFIVEEKDGIAIVSKNKKDFKFEIKGIDEYFSINGKVFLDISSKKKIRIYEQEDFLPILGYHYIVSNDKKITGHESLLEINEFAFEKQINFMTNVMGCRWFTLGELMNNYILKGEKIPQRACAINFDDGRVDSYSRAFPILKKYGIVATFYVITDMLEKKKYMTWDNLDEIYRYGNEIGSHTLFGGSLIKTDWYEKKTGKKFDLRALEEQLRLSKEKLEKRGYKVLTFSYPLGDWSDEIIKILRKSGYIAARAISKSVKWRDPRVSTVSFDDDFKWHMYYYKPERKSLKDLYNELSYDGWWQFEENYRVVNDENKNIRNLSSVKPTNRSYGSVSLEDYGDSIENKFILRHEGEFVFEIIGSTGKVNKGKYSDLKNIKIYIDEKPVKIKPNAPERCTSINEKYYCSYFFKISLKNGIHKIKVLNNGEHSLRLDKFRVYREFDIEDSYKFFIKEKIW